jgi:hypothetical protein
MGACNKERPDASDLLLSVLLPKPKPHEGIYTGPTGQHLALTRYTSPTQQGSTLSRQRAGSADACSLLGYRARPPRGQSIRLFKQIECCGAARKNDRSGEEEKGRRRRVI